VLTGVCVALLIGGGATADVRDHTRPAKNQQPAISESQAADLTLTLTEVAVRPIQTWVRTGARLDASRRRLSGIVQGPEGELVQAGQRIRAYPIESRSSMLQGRVTRVTPEARKVRFEAELASAGPGDSPYLLEIVVVRGDYLSIPNEAIIEEGDSQVVYVQMHGGHYVPRSVHTGLQGETYTEVMHGLEPGEQVVTFGSFFVDSEYKLKHAEEPQGEASGGHHHH
jgi:hypothetical protein